MTEKAGKAEGVTEYDSEFEGLCRQLDQIKVATEHMLTHVESIVQPNPSTQHTHTHLEWFYILPSTSFDSLIDGHAVHVEMQTQKLDIILYEMATLRLYGLHQAKINK